MRALVPILVLAASPIFAQEPADFDPAGLEARSDSFAFRSGDRVLGGQRTAVERTADGWRLTERTRIPGRMEQSTTVRLAEDLAPTRVRQEGHAAGVDTRIEIDYADGRATGSARTPTREGTVEERAIDVAVPSGVVDDNALQALMPALEWGEDAAWTVPILASGRGTVAPTTLRSTGIETVEVPAGTFEAYRVVLDREEAPTAFWITTGTPRRVVKVASLVAPFEAVLVE